MANDTGYAIENARTAEQAALMTDAAKQGKCIFCEIDFTKNKSLNRLGEFDPEGRDWPLLWVWKNPFPQEHQACHIMILPKRHIDNRNFNDEITDAEWLQILDARKWACKFFGIKGGGGVDRFGERHLNAGTIDHWHYQLQVPNGTGNVKATFFKDLSPIEQARRANRKVYSKKNLQSIDGYVVRNSLDQVLCENFRWGNSKLPNNPFVHTKEALGWIYSALKEWNEIPELECYITNATWTTEGIAESYAKEKFWELLAKKAVEISTAAMAKYGPRHEVLLYQNSAGRYLDADFRWSTAPYYFHWHAERYINEILKLTNDESPMPMALYWIPGQEPKETKCDSLTWIDDREEFEIG